MTGLLQGLRAWYRRKFRGFVAAPIGVGGRGTSWQQHPRTEVGFTCKCGIVQAFTRADYVVREREHRPDCQEVTPVSRAIAESAFADGERNARIRADMLAVCTCPVTDARYVRLCPGCRRGHWKMARQWEGNNDPTK
jgi:hypothetical protein